MRNAVLASRVEGTTTILSIVPEGTQVTKGELLVELESATLKDKATQQEIQVVNAEAKLKSAKENLQIQTLQNATDEEAAKLKLKLALLDLEKYEEGDFKQQMDELRAQVKLTTEAYYRAEDNYEYTTRMARKGYKTQNDVEADRNAKNKAELDRDLAQTKLRVFEEFSQKRSRTELKANSEEYARQVDRVQRKAAAALAQVEADVKSTQLTFDLESAKHKRLLAQIEACKIYAPQDGQVVYANSRDGRTTDAVLIEPQATVKERQPIINLPDLDQMKVNARIHESRISLVKPGLAVIVKVDAFSSETFHGEIDSVASVPSSTNGFRGDIKEYESVVRLTDDVDRLNRLRPGLNAVVEIMVDRREDVLQTPVQSIVTIGQKAYAFVIDGKDAKRREVQIGQTNGYVIEVVSGLEEGDQVVMNPRTQFAREITLLTEESLKQQQEQEQAEGSKPKADGAPAAPANPAKPATGDRKDGGDKPLRPEGAGDAKKPDGTPGAGGRPEGGAPPGATGGPGGAGPEGGGPGGRGGMGRRPGGGGEGGSGERPAFQFDPAAFFDRIDKNKDGKITKDEVDDRMLSRFDSMDADSDGGITLEEFQTAMSRFRPPAGGAPGSD